MAFVVVVVLIALLLGRATGGRLGQLGELPLRGWPLVVAAVAGQVVAMTAAAYGSGVARALQVSGLIGSAAALVLFLLRSRRLPGIPLVALGLLLNALVIGLNGAMPVSLTAAFRAGADTGAIAVGADPRHELAGEGTRLRALGDVVPVPAPWHPEVLSPGDCLVAAGLGLLVVTGMRRRPRRDRGQDAEAEPTGEGEVDLARRLGVR